MSSMGVSYPGLKSDVNAFLWNSIGCPILTYGMESIALSGTNIRTLKGHFYLFFQYLITFFSPTNFEKCKLSPTCNCILNL